MTIFNIKRFTCLMVLALCLAISICYAEEKQTGTQKAKPFSWRSVIGAHYRLDTDSYLGTVRGWPSHYLVGYHPDYTDIEHKGIKPTIGHFSGEKRYYDFSGYNRTEIQHIRKAKSGNILEDAAENSYNPDDYTVKKTTKKVGNCEKNVRQAMDKKIDIIHVVLGNVKPGRPEFKIFNEKNGIYFKDAVYQSVYHFNSGEFANKPAEIYYQLGNEVNAYTRFHMVPNPNAEKLNPSIRKIIPNSDCYNAADYVEYYLAPAVEAIQAASKDAYGDPNKIKIVCGSVSGIRKARSRKFLDALLNTTIRGERAPSLRGKQAWELIDVITIHYAHGDQKILQSIFDKWIKSCKVEGLWITEELGARGAGAFSVAQVVFRYLDFWSRNQTYWQPHAAKLTIWGDGRLNHPRSFGSGRESLDILGPFLQDYPLCQADEETLVVTNADVESYVLRVDVNKDIVRYAAYLGSYTGTRAKIRQLILRGPDKRGLKSVESIKAYVIDAAAGIKELKTELKEENGTFIIKFDYELPVTAAVVVLVEAKKKEK